ncbi:phage tail protein X [Janthinobacterium sp. HH103]|uniref:tail protein X n=1 Tax=unclassified Janthinobacterium TaxID=2610881 RepID=UPI000873DEA9|nr:MULTISPECIES: tail protein X [unclassified Janthinobacterium]OEZ70021.1 phage tail protein X [Janthinobacterium sp. HH100]OEZ70985.1 phage tail protein X [Janthinobacterium sp. HH103]QOU74283.1 Phage Tail Protein X [Janthinobacterium sp. HH102]
MQVRTQQHDTVDALVWRYLGDGAGYVEQALALNPALARYGAVLPAGLVVTLPEPAPSTGQVADIVQLWD